MGSMSCKPQVAIVYASVTGNTELLANRIAHELKAAADVTLADISSFPAESVTRYDAVLIGTYSWGEGEIPNAMLNLYDTFESADCRSLVTAVFGTGDSFYPNYCGAVNAFRDMLFVHTELAATLKVELAPQAEDRVRCRKLAQSVLNRLTAIAE
ncbi:flavodoxin domain-containing protein [Indiicoccus explosivorum]|uniref:flavodoxin domain-containing protein n=1 Tax=Indiicoccus explosivorum TaxID=1917864 RepID=UPI000B430296|nr:flavodoxin domain-containing protein [Indiicoccus explosivorum]